MLTNKVDRRADVHRNILGETFDAGVVQQGLLLQQRVNTVSAIEYMKNRGIASSTIQRVLTGSLLRTADREALAQEAGR